MEEKCTWPLTFGTPAFVLIATNLYIREQALARKISFYDRTSATQRHNDDDDENVVETSVAVCQTCDGGLNVEAQPTSSDVDGDVRRRQERRPLRAEEQRQRDSRHLQLAQRPLQVNLALIFFKILASSHPINKNRIRRRFYLFEPVHLPKIQRTVLQQVSLTYIVIQQVR